MKGVEMMKVLSVLLFCLWANVGFAQDAPVDLAFEVDGAKVVARDSVSHDVVWTNEYRSVQVHEGKPSFPIAGPIRLGEELFYAVRADLFAVDPKSGIVLRLQTYPALISDLKSTKTGMDIVLETHADDEPALLTVAYHANAILSPPMMSFGWAQGRAFKDAAPGDFLEFMKLDGKERQAVIERLSQDERRDPTNPFFPLLRGVFLEKAGLATESKAAIKHAMAIEANWSDKLQMAQILDIVGHTEMADTLYQAGKTQLREGGGNIDEFSGPIAFACAIPLTRAIEQAVNQDNVEEVDRLTNRLRDLLPSLEFRGATWIALSRWFAARADKERANLWAKRGRAALLQTTFTRSAAEIDLGLGVMVAAPLVVFLMTLLVLVRVGPNRPTRTEIASLVMLVVISALGLSLAMHRVALTDVLGNQPHALEAGEMADPETLKWLETLAVSPERDSLIADAKQARERLGTSVAPKPLDRQALSKAREREATAKSWRGLLRELGNAVLSGGRTSGFVFWGLLAVGLSVLVKQFSQKWRARLMLLIPGSHSGPFAPVVQLLFVLGVELAIFDGVLVAALRGNYAKFLGIPEAINVLNTTGYGLALASAALLVHVATIAFAWRSSRVAPAVQS